MPLCTRSLDVRFTLPWKRSTDVGGQNFVRGYSSRTNVARVSRAVQSTPYHAEVEAAVSAVERACQICLNVQSTVSRGGSVEKGDRTPVTIADLAIQALLTLELQELFPHMSLVGEEDAKVLREEGPMAHRATSAVTAVAQTPFPTNAILSALDAPSEPPCNTYWIGLAMVDKGEVVMGVMGLPNWSGGALVLSAIRGQGTFAHRTHSPQQSGSARADVRVDSTTEWGSAVVCISDHEEWATLPLAQGLEEGWECVKVVPLCCGSLCKYAAVAMGMASVFVQHPISTPNLKVWDHAAGVICVEEAGGKVTDFNGWRLSMGGGQRIFAPGGGGVVVTNGALHAATLTSIHRGYQKLGS